ncbi:hypothetical protein NL676_014882 [Syzygium grande]|nr:hypothetical protein NL676_014882 [Syzygium grande]
MEGRLARRGEAAASFRGEKSVSKGSRGWAGTTGKPLEPTKKTSLRILVHLTSLDDNVVGFCPDATSGCYDELLFSHALLSDKSKRAAAAARCRRLKANRGVPQTLDGG